MLKTESGRFLSKIRITTILILLLFVLPFFKNNMVSGNNESILFSEKANLALRRTAHLLLIENGDSTSLIPPVQQLDANTFNVKIDHLFDYEKLPQVLKESLELHQVKRPYDVSILNCTSNKILLGYNYQDLNQKGGVPCGGRKREPGCYYLKVSFYPESQTAASGNSWWILPLGSLLACLGFVVWRRAGKKPVPLVMKDAAKGNSTSKAMFGNSVLDMTLLSLVSASASYNLTYREAKLLNLFVSNKNRVLERDFILKSVWEDEGIIVGRSVDVFVSRLRKMLQNDEMVKITAVHGVGYRMEVSGI